MKSEFEDKLKNALIQLKLGEVDKAVVLYDDIAKREPLNEEILIQTFKAFYDKKEYDIAVKYLNMAIKVNPCPKYYRALANTHFLNENYKMSKECFLKQLELYPDDTDILLKLGISCLHNYEFQEAKTYFNKILSINPKDIWTCYNLAVAHRSLFEFEEAINCAVKALEIDPLYSEAMYLLSEIFLQLGNFVDGWKLYESRYFIEKGIADITSTKPKWDGAHLENKTIYIETEQGFGDCIMFARFIPLLSKMGAKVLFKPHSELKQLFINSEFPVKIVDYSTPIESLDFDFRLKIMSLAGLMNINEKNVPTTDRYLKANPNKVKEYRERYFNNDKLKIGINWKCKNLYPQDFLRSLPDISYILPVADISGIKLYSLQKGSGEEELKNLPEGVEIIDLGKTFKDFSDTAAAIENLDLVITVDTAIAHLSGALGKDTLILLQYLPNWKWLLNRDDSIWYEKVKLFKQEQRNDWVSAVNNAVKYIKAHYNL